MSNELRPGYEPQTVARKRHRERIIQPIPEGAKLHLGCGLNTPEGWTHVDGSWNALFSKLPFLRRILCAFGLLPKSQLDIKWDPRIIVKNINRGLPFANDSHSVVYASHLLEHLYLEEQKKLMQEIFRVLKPGGVFRAVVPDLKAIIAEYLGESEIEDPGPSHVTTRADLFNVRLGMRPSERPRGSILYRIYQAFTDLHSHKWVYDAESLAKYMEAAGFTRVAAMPLHVSNIPGIEAIEKPGRVEGGQGIVLEAIKPRWN